ncbi:MAG: gas vesicle accessory protein GvpU [Desulfoprunum sp.]|nr:gas vesicle accessory protein GvpU [Desulfoprunum sp.]
MINEEKNILTLDNPPQKDWFLQFLVNLANKNQFELGITLNIGGFLIAGTLVGVKQYFADFGADFAASLDAGKSPQDIKTFFKKIGDECACVSNREKTESPSYIHLKDARFFNTQGNPTLGNGGVWWRGRISEVQGFVPGNLFKPAVSSTSGNGE